jgi:hypothetical protein
MPRSRLETSLVVVGIGALGLILWLSVGAWHRYERERAAPEPMISVRTDAAPARATASVATTTSAPAVANRLTLTAARGASWVEIRVGSATGRQLYAGILRATRSIGFRGRRFWVSLGAASNVDAQFAGRPVRGLPKGVTTVTIDGPKATVVG